MQNVGQKDPSQALIDAWPYLGGLIVAAVVGGLVILAIRRKLLAKGQAEADESLMQTLRRMRDTGELSHEEYEASVRSIANRAVQRAEQRAEARADADAPQRPVVAPPPPPAQSRTTAAPRPAAPPAATPARPPIPPAPKPPPTVFDDFPPLIELPPDSPDPPR